MRTAVRAKFGVIPQRIPDYLALVGDAADGYPGIAGIGSKGAAGLIDRFGRNRRLSAGDLGRAQAIGIAFQEIGDAAR